MTGRAVCSLTLVVRWLDCFYWYAGRKDFGERPWFLSQALSQTS
jgi:hypothetical protein